MAVTDGDTLKILVGTTTTVIRLNGIDAPEKAQAFGTQSKNSLSSLAFGKTITVYPAGKDRYSRVLGWVFVGSTSVNSEQVKRGFAWWYRQYAPKEAKLAALETSARKARVGLWSDATPVAPWQWRSTSKKS
ncbi:micrococcal nuclease [bacterium]|nr:MAG: micrococcal nuclease [bacterium]